MSINTDLLRRLKSKTENDPEIQKFLLQILQKEKEGLGWYKDYYKEKIEEFCRED